MAENSNIEWTHHTFNAWIGCTKVSPGCKNCYAEADFDKRKGRAQWGANGTRSVTSYDNWRKVLSWQRKAKEAGIRHRVFVNSLADTFERFDHHVVDHKRQPIWFAHEDRDADELPAFRTEVPEQWSDLYVPLTLDILRRELFRLIDMCPNLDFLLLTKRPENILRMWPKPSGNPHRLEQAIGLDHFPNVWLGISAEDQERFNQRAPYLREVRGLCKHAFVSMEPMLGPINVREQLHIATDRDGLARSFGAIDWIIVGGESGAGKRPFDPEWARKVRDMCVEAGIAFFGKQWDKVQQLPDDLLIREFPDGLAS